jgi:hypothetical protein
MLTNGETFPTAGLNFSLVSVRTDEWVFWPCQKDQRLWQQNKDASITLIGIILNDLLCKKDIRMPLQYSYMKVYQRIKNKGLNFFWLCQKTKEPRGDILRRLLSSPRKQFTRHITTPAMTICSKFRALSAYLLSESAGKLTSRGSTAPHTGRLCYPLSTSTSTRLMFRAVKVNKALILCRLVKMNCLCRVRRDISIFFPERDKMTAIKIRTTFYINTNVWRKVYFNSV